MTGFFTSDGGPARRAVEDARTALCATDGGRPPSEANAAVPVWILDPATTAPPEQCASEGETGRINEMRPLHRFSVFSSLHIPTETRTSLGPLAEKRGDAPCTDCTFVRLVFIPVKRRAACAWCSRPSVRQTLGRPRAWNWWELPAALPLRQPLRGPPRGDNSHAGPDASPHRGQTRNRSPHTRGTLFLVTEERNVCELD